VISHRPADLGFEPELRFICDSWVASYRDADTSGIIQVGDWYPVMIPQVIKILAKEDVRATVAYETSNPDRGSQAYGFIVADTVAAPALVYYVFVKSACRRGGVARGLFAAIGIDPTQRFNYVCSTPMAGLLRRKVPMAKWTPKLGRYPKHERRNA
jgi:hypothetical protein